MVIFKAWIFLEPHLLKCGKILEPLFLFGAIFGAKKFRCHKNFFGAKKILCGTKSATVGNADVDHVSVGTLSNNSLYYLYSYFLVSDFLRTHCACVCMGRRRL